MHFSELRWLWQVRRYTGLKPTWPQIQYLICWPISPKMVKNTFSPKNQKKGCGGFHFHLPEVTFYVPVRNLAPTYPLQFFTFSSGLFFEHFEKTQGLPEKNSRHILDKKLKRVESTQDFSQKTQGKLTLMGSFFEEWQDFGHFYYQIDHILSKNCLNFK